MPRSRYKAGRACTGIRIDVLLNTIFGQTQFSVIHFHSLDGTDAVSWVKMDHWKKNGVKRFVENNIYYRYSFRSSSFAIYVHSNRPIKLESLPRLDPHTDVWSTFAGCYCQIKSGTWRISVCQDLPRPHCILLLISPFIADLWLVFT